ncbi:MAG TPA: hypothetical protein VGN72_07490 [Tepidisphaeraceae bacterium]|jgi:hypothetical protein|nr:hypothetical protein [Tepidisphaeraceae bacterium]
MHFVRLFVAMSLLFCSWSGLPRASAELPGVKDPGARTEAAFRRDLLAFNQKTMSAVYAKAGVRNPAWDEQAKTFLDAVAIRFSNSGVSVVSRVPNERALPELLQMGADLIGLKCTDPLVLYCYASLLEEAGKEEAIAHLVAACDGFADSEYPMFRRLRAMARLMAMRVQDDHAEAVARADAFFRKHVAEIGRSVDPTDPAGPRLIVELWSSALWPPARQVNVFREQAVGAMLADPQADPWISNVIAGRAAIDRAWLARGGGWARDVNDDAWETFFEELTIARDHLQRAHAIAPQRPEAAASLIPVAMGAGDRLNLDVRQCFEDAIEAQLDYKPAFLAYRNAILPRWGGNYPLMMALARECVEGDRYDTDLPFQYQETLEAIMADGGRAFVLTPAIYDFTKPILVRLGRAVKFPEFVKYHDSYDLAFALKVKRYDDARDALDRTGGAPVDLALRKFDLSIDEAVGKTLAMTGPHGKEMVAIEQDLLDATRRANGVEALRQVADRMGAAKADDPAKRFVHGRLMNYERPSRMATGEWIDLMPDSHLTGWRPQIGVWTVADGKLTGEYQGPPPQMRGVRGPGIVMNAPLASNRFAVTMTVAGEFPSFAFRFNDDPLAMQGAIVVAMTTRQLLFGTERLPEQFDPKPDGCEVLAEVWDGQIWLTINGKRMVDGRPLPEPQIGRLILELFPPLPNKRGSFSNLKLRGLTERPK